MYIRFFLFSFFLMLWLRCLRFLKVHDLCKFSLMFSEALPENNSRCNTNPSKFLHVNTAHWFVGQAGGRISRAFLNIWQICIGFLILFHNIFTTKAKQTNTYHAAWRNDTAKHQYFINTTLTEIKLHRNKLISATLNKKISLL